MKESFRSSLAFLLGPFLGLLSGPILARLLGPEGRGQFAAIMQPLTLGTAFACIGLPTTITFFISKGFSITNLRLRSLMIGSTSCTLIYILLALYSEKISVSQNLDRGFLITLWGSLYISALIELRRGIILGLGYTRKLDNERILIASLRFMGILLILNVSKVRVEFFSLVIISLVLISSLLLWFPRVKIPNSLLIVERSEFTKYLLPASAVSLSLFIAARIDQVILPLQTSSTELGYYAVAVTVAEVPLIFTNLISRTTFKSAANGGTFRSQIDESAMFFALGFASILVIFLLAPFGVKLIFGNEFINSIPIARTLCLSSFFAIINSAIVFQLNGSGKPIGAAIASFSALIPILIGFSFNWGEVYGSTAAWINVYSQIAVMSVGLLILKGPKYIGKS